MTQGWEQRLSHRATDQRQVGDTGPNEDLAFSFINLSPMKELLHMAALLFMGAHHLLNWYTKFKAVFGTIM